MIGEGYSMHDHIKPYFSNDGRCPYSQSYQSLNGALDLGHDICAMMSERVVVLECLGSVNCSGGVKCVWCA